MYGQQNWGTTFFYRDRCNHHNSFAVATCRGSNVVGHMPRKISAICYVFLGKPGAVISCTVTGSRRYSHDLPQVGLKIPCAQKFTEDKRIVSKAAILLKQIEKPLTEPVVNIAVSNAGCAKVDTSFSDPQKAQHQW